MGIWIQTYTGQKVNPFNPDPETINIQDIAHALSNICRFTGHCSKFYSVAEHSYLISNIVSKENALYGLLHDSAEAYIADISAPVKPYINGYKELENNLLSVIFRKFGLSPEIPKEVKQVDLRMCVTEGKVLMPDISQWKLKEQPYDNVYIHGFIPQVIKAKFLVRFHELS